MLIALSVLSLKGLLVINAQWLDAIKLLGCLYIGYLGLQIFREVFFEQAEVTQEKLSPVRGGFQQGFLVGISNPKDIIFFAAFSPVYRDYAHSGFKFNNANPELDRTGFSDFIFGLFGL